jgi:hypothetical protein
MAQIMSLGQLKFNMHINNGIDYISTKTCGNKSNCDTVPTISVKVAKRKSPKKVSKLVFKVTEQKPTQPRVKFQQKEMGHKMAS